MLKKAIAVCILVVLVLINIVVAEETTVGTINYERKIEEFFAKIKDGKVEEAVDFIYSENPWITQDVDGVQNVKTQLIGLDKIIGKYQGYEKLLEKKVADRFVYLYYFVAYERQPVRFIFEYYRPKDKWVIYSFSFDAEIDTEIEDWAKTELFIE